MSKIIGTPQEHHNCQGKYPSWETVSDYSEGKTRWLYLCYGCSRSWYIDTGEEYLEK